MQVSSVVLLELLLKDRISVDDAKALVGVSNGVDVESSLQPETYKRRYRKKQRQDLNLSSVPLDAKPVFNKGGKVKFTGIYQSEHLPFRRRFIKDERGKISDLQLRQLCEDSTISIDQMMVITSYSRQCCEKYRRLILKDNEEKAEAAARDARISERQKPLLDEIKKAQEDRQAQQGLSEPRTDVLPPSGEYTLIPKEKPPVTPPEAPVADPNGYWARLEGKVLHLLRKRRMPMTAASIAYDLNEKLANIVECIIRLIADAKVQCNPIPGPVSGEDRYELTKAYLQEWEVNRQRYRGAPQ